MSDAITKDDLLAYIQPFWAEITEACEVLAVDAAELTQADGFLQSVIDNLFVMTADRSLTKWERIFQLDVKPTDTLTQRRERISARLRAQGTVTKQSIENVAAAFSGGEVDVIEDFANYSVTVKFVGTFGVPADLPSLTAVLRDTLPAHIAFVYAYTYMTWAQFDAQNYVWDAIDGQVVTWDDVDNGALA